MCGFKRFVAEQVAGKSWTDINELIDQLIISMILMALQGCQCVVLVEQVAGRAQVAVVSSGQVVPPPPPPTPPNAYVTCTLYVILMLVMMCTAET